MKKMIATLCLLYAASANAQCFGTGNYRSCYDPATGNQYNTIRFGGTSITNGSNAVTGSTWSQTTNRIGGTTSITNGIDSDGRSWSQTINRVGDTTYQHGTDATGKPFNCIITRYGSSC